jgi:pimeloyl-ACP methyl ester carboxylesterase
MNRFTKAVVAVAGAWTAWRLLGPDLPRHERMRQVRPLRIPGRSVFVGEREFFLRETGPEDGPLLVLIHGWSLDGEMTYHRILPALAERYRIVMPDLRDHGHSDWIRGRYDVVQLADEVAGVLDALQLPKAIVFGYSLGGMVAQELTRRHHRLVGSLVLAATAARPVPKWRLLTRLAFFGGRLVGRISRREGVLITMAALRMSGALDPAHERWIHDGLMRRDAGLFYEAGAAAMRFDSRDWVGRLGVPVTVVVAGQDLIVPTATQEELAALVPGAKVVRLDDAGHESILTRPDVYIALLLGMLDGEAGSVAGAG